MGVWDGLDECEISRSEILSQSTPGGGDVGAGRGMRALQPHIYNAYLYL